MTRAAIAFGLAAALLAGCAREAAVDPATLPLPEPDLSQIEPTLRAGLERDQERIFALARDPAADPDEVAKAFGELGMVYHTYELRDAALVCYGNTAALLPEDPRWPYLSARIHQHVGAVEEAEAGYLRTLDLAPGDLPSRIYLGDLYLQNSRPEDARQTLERALELDASSAAVHFGLGRAGAALGDDENALRHFETALELAPGATVVHYPLSQAYRRLGRLDEARRHLELRGRERVDFEDPVGSRLGEIQLVTALRVLQTLAAEPGDVADEELMGFAVSKLGSVKRTVEELESHAGRVDQAAPDDRAQRARLRYLLGGLEVYRDRDAAAIEQFRQAVELAPELIDAEVKLANALARTGKLEEAVGRYDRVLGRRPDATDVVLKKATALLNLRRVDEARLLLRELVAARPGDAVPHVRLAELYEAAGQPEIALERYREALELEMADRERARIHRGLAGYYQRRGETESALAELRQATERDPTLVDARLELAGLLGLDSRYPEAAVEYRRVISDVPRNPRARYGEAAALVLDGRYAEARERLEEGVAILPDEAGLRHLLARLLAAAPADGLRDGERALELALEAHQATPTAAVAETVAMAYAEVGEFERAVDWQHKALAEAGPGASRERLGLFESDRPYRAGSPFDLLVAR